MNHRSMISSKLTAMTIIDGFVAVGGFTVPEGEIEHVDPLSLYDYLDMMPYSGYGGYNRDTQMVLNPRIFEPVNRVPGPLIPNKDKIKINLASFWAKVEEEDRPWYRHSAGGVSRKPLYKGQSPVLEKIVVSGYGVPV